MDKNKSAGKLSVVEALFAEARKQGGIDYLYTLVRVSGLTAGVNDPLLSMRSMTQASASGLSDDEVFSQYCPLAGSVEPLHLVANLLNCVRGRPYSVSPFQNLNKGTFPNIILPVSQRLSRLTERGFAFESAHHPAFRTTGYEIS